MIEQLVVVPKLLRIKKVKHFLAKIFFCPNSGQNGKSEMLPSTIFHSERVENVWRAKTCIL